MTEDTGHGARWAQQDIADLIERAKELPPMTDAERNEQRESFVRGQMGMGSDADETAYRMKYRQPQGVDNMPKGWWIIPAVIVGALIWWAVLT